MKATTRIAIIGIALAALVHTGYGQIQILDTRLIPPGAPQDDVMKTLDAVEPRIAINAINTPGSPFSSVYDILVPGSYYLTENMMGAQATTGIHVFASNVTIDLNGYGLIGSTNTSPNNGPGIVIETNAHSVVIQNGFVTLFQGGIISKATNTTFRNIRCTHNNSDGLRSSTFSQVYDCSFLHNANDGVEVGDHSRVAGVLARKNNYGIVVGPGSLVQNCVVRENTNHGIRLNGRGSRVSSCVSEKNNIGISIDANRCTAVNNTCAENTSEGIASGILGSTEYTDCVIDGNHVSANGSRGILVTGTDNIVVRNYSYDNATAFVVLASNQMGTVVSGIDAVGIAGSSGGNLDATVGPWSNFAR